ncbi:MAG: AmmeMemoRadiSam system protein B [Candidatus Limnocylindrales bacterium]
MGRDAPRDGSGPAEEPGVRQVGIVREPAVAGSFYPDQADGLRGLVHGLLARAAPAGAAGPPMGVLVPHAGLAYSGLVAAAGWRALLDPAGPAPTVVVLGTNHRAWFDGVAVDPGGAWRLPTGDVSIDADLAERIVALGDPFGTSRVAHRDEHSIEVQLPLALALRPGLRIVPCSVAAGTGVAAIEAGTRLGAFLAEVRDSGVEALLAISTDMAHYPAHDEAVRVTERLGPAICALDPHATAALERAVAASGVRGIACGMCGIQPTVLGLATLRAMGATAGRVVAAATSADAGGPRDRTVGYLAVAFA